MSQRGYIGAIIGVVTLIIIILTVFAKHKLSGEDPRPAAEEVVVIPAPSSTPTPDAPRQDREVTTGVGDMTIKVGTITVVPDRVRIDTGSPIWQPENREEDWGDLPEPISLAPPIQVLRAAPTSHDLRPWENPETWTSWMRDADGRLTNVEQELWQTGQRLDRLENTTVKGFRDLGNKLDRASMPPPPALTPTPTPPPGR
jgi:hypothetical protein